MFKLLKLFIWIIVFLAALLAIDQFLLRVQLDLPGVKPAQTFYVDFRSRLIGLLAPQASLPGQRNSIEEVIESNAEQPPQKVAKQRYLYVDDSGVLQFADSLRQVPAQYRQSAQPLSD